MTILNIRGTSGSGKTTLARAIMEHYGPRVVYRVPDRKQPLGYVYQHPAGGRPLSVLGHYETNCGGCDTINTGYETIFDLVRQSHAAGNDVLFEGLLVSGDFRHFKALWDELGEHMRTVFLATPYEECVRSINERRVKTWEAKCAEVDRFNQELEMLRQEKGRQIKKDREKPEKPEEYTDAKGNTASKFKGLERQRMKFMEEGINHEFLDRGAALRYCLEQLEIPL